MRLRYLVGFISLLYSLNSAAQVDFYPKQDYHRFEFNWCAHSDIYYLSFANRTYELEAEIPISYSNTANIKGFKSFYNYKKRKDQKLEMPLDLFDYYEKQFSNYYDSLLFRGSTLLCQRVCVNNSVYYVTIQYADKGESYYVTIIQKETESENIDAAQLYRDLNEKGKTNIFLSSEKNDTVIYEKDIWMLDAIVEMMNLHPEIQLNIEAHTDKDGDRKELIYLSYCKARYFYQTLVALGAPQNRMNYSGYGPDFPILDNTDCSGKITNNRIVLSLK